MRRAVFLLKTVILLGALAYGLVCIPALSSAGNREMIEDTVQELDELNKQAVSQIPDLPKDGKVYMKANVTYDKEGSPIFDIYYKEISSPVKEEGIELERNQQVKTSEKEEREKNVTKND